jgi:antitoxin VapB
MCIRCVYTYRMATGKVFQSGNSQAVRLPKDFRLLCDEVEIVRGEGGILRLIPKGWDSLFALLDEDGATGDFMAEGDGRDDLPPSRGIETL